MKMSVTIRWLKSAMVLSTAGLTKCRWSAGGRPAGSAAPCFGAATTVGRPPTSALTASFRAVSGHAVSRYCLIY
jgi:hypothetical protein